MNDETLLGCLIALFGALIVVTTAIAFTSPGATVAMAFAVIIGSAVWWLDL